MDTNDEASRKGSYNPDPKGIADGEGLGSFENALGTIEEEEEDTAAAGNTQPLPEEVQKDAGDVPEQDQAREKPAAGTEEQASPYRDIRCGKEFVTPDARKRQPRDQPGRNTATAAIELCEACEKAEVATFMVRVGRGEALDVMRRKMKQDGAVVMEDVIFQRFSCIQLTRENGIRTGLQQVFFLKQATLTEGLQANDRVES